MLWSFRPEGKPILRYTVGKDCLNIIQFSIEKLIYSSKTWIPIIYVKFISAQEDLCQVDVFWKKPTFIISITSKNDFTKKPFWRIFANLGLCMQNFNMFASFILKINPFLHVYFRVWTFWKGLKNLKPSSSWFDVCLFALLIKSGLWWRTYGNFETENYI